MLLLTELQNIKSVSLETIKSYNEDIYYFNRDKTKVYIRGLVRTNCFYIRECFYDELLKYTENNPTTPEELWAEIDKRLEEEKRKEMDKRNKYARDKRRNNLGITSKEENKIVNVLKVKYLKSLGIRQKDIAGILKLNKSTVSKYLKIELNTNLVLTDNIKEELKSFLK